MKRTVPLAFALLLAMPPAASSAWAIGILDPAEGTVWNDCPDELWVVPTDEDDIDLLVTTLLAEDGTVLMQKTRESPAILWETLPTRRADGDVAIPYGDRTLVVEATRDGVTSRATRAVTFAPGVAADERPPTTSLRVFTYDRPIDGWYWREVAVDVVVTDDCRRGDVAVTLDDAEAVLHGGSASGFLVGDSPRTLRGHLHVAQHGTHEIAALGVDLHGNLAAPANLTVALDLTPPDVVIDLWQPSPTDTLFQVRGDPLGGEANATVTLGCASFVAHGPREGIGIAGRSDAPQIAWSIDGAPTGQADDVVSLCFRTPGLHAVTAAATDRAGRTGGSNVFTVRVLCSLNGETFEDVFTSRCG